MFKKDEKHETVACLGESLLIKKLQKWLSVVSLDSPKGIGDDCAVVHLRSDCKLLLTTDSLTYKMHFDSSTSARNAGSKLIKRNLSDIASMGGIPSQALLNLLMGPNLCITWLQEFIAGARDECLKHGVKIIGGDISTLTEGHFSAVLTQTGYMPSGVSPLLRSTAQENDHLYVTGELGGSLISKHYAFEPRLGEGQWLAKNRDCTALMDLTDGLAKDLQSLIPDGLAASLHLGQIPISQDALKCSSTSNRSAMEHAFCDGEDYELLFSVNGSASCAKFESQWLNQFPNIKLSRIGRIIEPVDPTIKYLDAVTQQPIAWTQGFEHLKVK